ncbi:helix-turn-helix transcriptional regulator [Paenibacillus lautus]|uniref:helix-turn-helix transcriptional regulator n=1 Tax=Paenibacillus lautus TaxID=1401 RepID=UPI001C7E1B57|nr:helix-turn-helix transcriptional regulator [Paenibacillus lautus]MBX4145936.1 helix-turn-helix transcriptional regulator [Paenibacillus lautus]
MKRAALKEARQFIGLTQIQAAESLGVHVEHIRSLEYGRVNPSLKLMFKICNLYKNSPEKLFPDLNK